MAPVFLHTGWRTRGTWIWSRLRDLEGARCYYEPLAEDLATLCPAGIESCHSASWSSGHPPMPRPYFSEYRPLLKTVLRGVRHYDPNFAVAEFFAEPDAATPELRDYIALLLRTASGEGGQPVLKFCRSLGRIGWMQRNFPEAIHVAVMRNPLAQFVSAQRQFRRHGNPYFLAMPLLLLAMHRDVPDVAAAIRQLAVALPSLPAGVPLRASLAACEADLRRTQPVAWYRGFLAFWAVTAASIPETIDLMIDSDLLDQFRGLPASMRDRSGDADRPYGRYGRRAWRGWVRRQHARDVGIAPRRVVAGPWWCRDVHRRAGR